MVQKIVIIVFTKFERCTRKVSIVLLTESFRYQLRQTLVTDELSMLLEGGSPGVGVIGKDSCLRGRGFETPPPNQFAVRVVFCK